MRNPPAVSADHLFGVRPGDLRGVHFFPPIRNHYSTFCVFPFVHMPDLTCVTLTATLYFFYKKGRWNPHASVLFFCFSKSPRRHLKVIYQISQQITLFHTEQSLFPLCHWSLKGVYVQLPLFSSRLVFVPFMDGKDRQRTGNGVRKAAVDSP